MTDPAITPAQRFSEKVMLVTGGRSGIGRAIVQRFQLEGARVFTAQRQPDENCDHFLTDLNDADAPQKLINRLIDQCGKLDILVNNAGVMQETLAELQSIESWQTHLNINLTAPFLLTKYALPHLRKTKGCIVNIGSIEGLGANPNHAAYCASKAGLHGLTRAIAVDHGHEGIRCNAVAPGWIDTDLNTNFIESMPDPSRFRQGLKSIHPVGRTGNPAEVAGLVAFLASSDSAFITGQVYTIDGGRTTQLSLP